MRFTFLTFMWSVPLVLFDLAMCAWNIYLSVVHHSWINAVAAVVVGFAAGCLIAQIMKMIGRSQTVHLQHPTYWMN